MSSPRMTAQTCNAVFEGERDGVSGKWRCQDRLKEFICKNGDNAGRRYLKCASMEDHGFRWVRDPEAKFRNAIPLPSSSAPAALPAGHLKTKPAQSPLEVGASPPLPPPLPTQIAPASVRLPCANPDCSRHNGNGNGACWKKMCLNCCAAQAEKCGVKSHNDRRRLPASMGAAGIMAALPSLAADKPPPSSQPRVGFHAGSGSAELQQQLTHASQKAPPPRRYAEPLDPIVRAAHATSRVALGVDPPARAVEGNAAIVGRRPSGGEEGQCGVEGVEASKHAWDRLTFWVWPADPDRATGAIRFRLVPRRGEYFRLSDWSFVCNSLGINPSDADFVAVYDFSAGRWDWISVQDDQPVGCGTFCMTSMDRSSATTPLNDFETGRKAVQAAWHLEQRLRQSVADDTAAPDSTQAPVGPLPDPSHKSHKSGHIELRTVPAPNPFRSVPTSPKLRQQSASRSRVPAGVRAQSTAATRAATPNPFRSVSAKRERSPSPAVAKSSKRHRAQTEDTMLSGGEDSNVGSLAASDDKGLVRRPRGGSSTGFADRGEDFRMPRMPPPFRVDRSLSPPARKSSVRPGQGFQDHPDDDDQYASSEHEASHGERRAFDGEHEGFDGERSPSDDELVNTDKDHQSESADDAGDSDAAAHHRSTRSKSTKAPKLRSKRKANRRFRARRDSPASSADSFEFDFSSDSMPAVKSWPSDYLVRDVAAFYHEVRQMSRARGSTNTKPNVFKRQAAWSGDEVKYVKTTVTDYQKFFFRVGEKRTLAYVNKYPDNKVRKFRELFHEQWEQSKLSE